MTASSTPLYTLSLHDALPISFRNNQRPGYLNYWSPASTVRVTTRKFRQSLVSFISQLFEQTNLSGVVAKNRRSEEHTSELQSHSELVCRLLLEKKNGRARLYR